MKDVETEHNALFGRGLHVMIAEIDKAISIIENSRQTHKRHGKAGT